jgi:hypothetical protein
MPSAMERRRTKASHREQAKQVTLECYRRHRYTSLNSCSGVLLFTKEIEPDEDGAPHCQHVRPIVLCPKHQSS